MPKPDFYDSLLSRTCASHNRKERVKMPEIKKTTAAKKPEAVDIKLTFGARPKNKTVPTAGLK